MVSVWEVAKHKRSQVQLKLPQYLGTSQVHQQLDGCTLTMNQWLLFYNIDIILSEPFESLQLHHVISMRL